MTKPAQVTLATYKCQSCGSRRVTQTLTHIKVTNVYIIHEWDGFQFEDEISQQITDDTASSWCCSDCGATIADTIIDALKAQIDQEHNTFMNEEDEDHE